MPLKIIPATARERKRYLLVKIETASAVSPRDIENAIINACLQFMGELGVGKSGTFVMSDTFNPKANTVIVRTDNKNVDIVKSAISLIKTISDKKARLSVTKVSGAIDKLKSS